LDKKSVTKSEHAVEDWSDWCFFEPAAGTGVIFRALPSTAGHTLGLEIDPKLASSSNFSCGNFLRTARHELSIPPSCTSLCVIGNPPYTAHTLSLSSDSKSSGFETSRKKDARHANNEEQRRKGDIAFDFVKHSIIGLQADAVRRPSLLFPSVHLLWPIVHIAFDLPDRCHLCFHAGALAKISEKGYFLPAAMLV
jgi:hypothetical protein